MLTNVLTLAPVKKGAFVLLLGLAGLVLLGAAGTKDAPAVGDQWEYCRALHWDVGTEGRRSSQAEAGTSTSREPTWWFTPGCVPGNKVDASDEDTVLKQLGMHGWRLVSVKDERPAGGMQQTIFYFIRSKR